MFAFGNAATGFADLATEVDSVTQELGGVLNMLSGQSGLPIDAHISKIQHTISGANGVAMSMMDTSSACAAQDAADAALAAAPTQREVDLAAAFARDLRALALAGHGSMQQAELAAEKAAEKAERRQEALDAHEAATGGTHFEAPESTKWTPPGTGDEGAEKKRDEEDEGEGYGDWEDETDKPGDEPGTQPPVEQRQMPVPTPQPATEPSVAGPRISTDDPAFSRWVSQQSDSAAPAMTLSSADGPAPTTTATPTYNTTVPQPTPIANQPTVASPQWMQQPTPPPTGPSSQNQLRPYGPSNPSNHPSQQTRRTEDERQLPLDGAAAVMSTQTHHVTSPAPAMPVSSPTPTALAAPPVAPLGQMPPAGQSPAGTGPAGTGPAGAAPVGPTAPAAANQAQAAKPKIEAAPRLEVPEELRKVLSDEEVSLFQEALDANRDNPTNSNPYMNPHAGVPR